VAYKRLNPSPVPFFEHSPTIENSILRDRLKPIFPNPHSKAIVGKGNPSLLTTMRPQLLLLTLASIAAALAAPVANSVSIHAMNALEEMLTEDSACRASACRDRARTRYFVKVGQMVIVGTGLPLL